MRTNLFLKSFIFTAIAVLVAVSYSQGQEVPPKPEQPALEVHEHVLGNGLRLLVVPRPGVPLVSTYVWYKVGSMDEKPGQTGMAHFLEHMMFKGSRNYKVGDVDKVTQRNGGSNNAFTSNDYTAYYFELPKSRYKEALKIEADRMRHLTLDLTEFDSEKKVVQSESDISADDPSSQLWEKLGQALYGSTHPYSHPVLGHPQDVEDISRRDMRLFYDAHYHPNHATMVMVGDITDEEALGAVKGHFGNIPRGPDLNRPEPTEVVFNGPVEFEVKNQVDVIELGRQYPTARSGHADVPALDVLGMILGSGVTSRLYRSVVEDKRLATGISCGNYDQRLGGTFWLWAQLAPDTSREELIEAIELEIQQVIDAGVTADELDRTKNRFISDRIFSQESASSLAQSLGSSQTVYDSWKYTLEYPDLIRGVTAQDVRRVAAAYLYPKNSATGWLVPKLSKDPSGESIADARPEPLGIKRVVLLNGLTVLLLERRGLPVVSVQAAVRAGKSGESAAENGLSSFTGALLDVGTRDFTKQQIAETLETIGGELGVSDGGASVKVLTEHTDTGLNLLSQVMQYPTFPDAEIELARDQTLAGLEASRNETGWFARNAAAAALYGADNPLGRPSDGSVKTVNSFSRKQVVDWHSRYFRPDNCIVAAVGDFDSDAMLKRISEKFGSWKKPSTPLKFPEFDFKRPAKLEGEQVFSFTNFDPSKVDSTRKRILIDHPEKDQVVVRLQTIGIRRDNPDYYPLLVMDNILGTSPGFTDRFSGTLRDKMGLAYSTYANISAGSGIYQGSFLGYIGTRAENVELALQTMYRLIEEIRTEPVSDDEINAARDYLKGSFVFDLETTGQLGSLLINIERYQLGADYLVKYADAISAVTKEDITRVAKKYLVPEQMVEVLAGPVTKITPLPDTPEGD
ncbi:MAG: insulinase family protein [Planctomycetes bacterium]|nr:insulinase family protein [Planctomycetota bacterium]